MGYEKRYDFCAMTGESHVEKVPLRRQQNKLKASKMNEAKILFRLYNTFKLNSESKQS